MSTSSSKRSSSAGAYQNFKVVLLGEGCVGKTSIAVRFVEDKWSDKHVTTIQVITIPFSLNRAFLSVFRN